MTAPARTDVTYAEANWGRWIARCPRPYCTNALALMGPEETIFVCVAEDGCGQVAEIIWPPDPDAIKTLLLMRPVPRTRSWVPGETVDDILIENAAHGCIPQEWHELAASSPGGILALNETENGVVVGGVLYQAIEAARRHEIEAEAALQHEIGE